VDIKSNNGQPVIAALEGSGGSESRVQTPTADALAVALAYYKTVNDGIMDRFVLLSTDGEPNTCTGSGDCPATDTAVKNLLAAGIKTFVLGVSEEVASSACLDQLAVSGGAPRATAPHFYPGSDPMALDAYLNEIITGIAKPSCVIDLNDAPPDPKLVALFIDGREIARDTTHVDGWDYSGPKQITFYGAACMTLQSGTATSLNVRFGCPPSIVK
jgi:hypothetical protein